VVRFRKWALQFRNVFDSELVTSFGDLAWLVTVAGPSCAAVWIAAKAGRLLFAYGASHWFAAGVVVRQPGVRCLPSW